MKNTLCLILTLLFMTLTFTPSSITQTSQDDPQQGDFPDGEKTRIGKGKHRINDIKFSPDIYMLANTITLSRLAFNLRCYCLV